MSGKYDYNVGYYKERRDTILTDETYEKPDPVNHPTHYTSHPSGVECISVSEHHNFCIGSAIKYLWRAGLKRDADKTVDEKTVEDLRKAVWYINREISRLTGVQE